MEDINGKHVKPYTPNLKNGLELSRRVANTFWDLLEARSNAELIDINEWSKEMDQKNCGWKEYALKESLIESTSDILRERKQQADLNYVRSIPVADIRNKLTPMSNLITMLENGLIKADVETHALINKEIEQCKISIEYLSRKENKDEEK